MRSAALLLVASACVVACASSSTSSPCRAIASGVYTWHQESPTPCALVAPVSTVTIAADKGATSIDDGAEPLNCRPSTYAQPQGGACEIDLICAGHDPDGTTSNRTTRWTVDAAGDVTGTHSLVAQSCGSIEGITDTLTRQR